MAGGDGPLGAAWQHASSLGPFSLRFLAGRDGTELATGPPATPRRSASLGPGAVEPAHRGLNLRNREPQMNALSSHSVLAGVFLTAVQSCQSNRPWGAASQTLSPALALRQPLLSTCRIKCERCVAWRKPSAPVTPVHPVSLMSLPSAELSLMGTRPTRGEERPVPQLQACAGSPPPPGSPRITSKPQSFSARP